MNYAGKYDEMEATQVAEGIERRIIQTDHLMMVNVEFTDGPTDAPDPFHDHPHEQVSYVAAGRIYLFVGDEEKVLLEAGDHYAIPPDLPHTIQRLSDYVNIIDCFTPLREDFLS